MALLRGLRRGIGLYIDEPTLTAYRRTVMRLANKGALAVVLSDSSLAFGVNMPFRTTVFAGEMGGLLDPLMAQQMSGRAGRRGLDQQGHIVYAASHASFIRNIMIGQIPAITGTGNPRSETQFILSINSWYLNDRTFPHKLQVLDAITLNEYCNNQSVVGFNDHCKSILMGLGIIQKCKVITDAALEVLKAKGNLELDLISFYGDRYHYGTPSGYCPNEGLGMKMVVLWVMWEMRDTPAESFALGRLLPHILGDFRESNKRIYGFSEKPTDSDISAFFAKFLHIIDRHPCKEGHVPMHQHPLFLQNPSSWEEWEERLERYHQTLASIPNTDNLRLSVPIGEPIDSAVLDVFFTNSIAGISPEMRKEIRGRIWHVGNIFRILHNNLYPDEKKYGKLEIFTRICFQRLKYLNSELIQAEMNFREVCSYDYESRTDTGARPTREIAPWGDAGTEPVILDPFTYSRNVIKTTKPIRIRGGLRGMLVKPVVVAQSVTEADQITTLVDQLSTEAHASDSSLRRDGNPDKMAELIKEAKRMKPNDLKGALKSMGLSIQGNKNDLLSRYLDAIKQEYGQTSSH